MANRAKTTEQFKQEVYNLVQDDYTVLGNYVTNKTKILIRHNKCGYEWNVEPSSFLKGTRCPECARNSTRKTQEQFEKEVYDLVGEEFTVLGKYVNTATKIKMRHNVCGNEIDIIPNMFLRGNRCNICGMKITGEKNRKTDSDFKKEIYSLVGEEYMPLTKYEGCDKKILFRHNKCGNEFKMKPNGFISSGNRCPKCSIEHRSQLRTKTYEDFIEEMHEKGKDEYLVLSSYINRREKIKLKHIKCNFEFEIYPYNFLNSTVCSCPKCNNQMTVTTDTFKKEVFDLVGDEYSVLGEYHSAHSKILLKHNSCGNIYEGSRNMFLKGHRCPQCNSSHGEERIIKYLQNKSIDYKPQKTFKGLVGVGGGNLKYDFYIPKYNVLIEYNGRQHYKPIEFFGGKEQLKIQKEHDMRKRKYAEEHNYKFLEIGYWEINNIENILNDLFREAA